MDKLLLSAMVMVPAVVSIAGAKHEWLLPVIVTHGVMWMVCILLARSDS